MTLIYFRDRLFKYPLTLTNFLKHLGPIDVSLTALSYLQTWLNPSENTCCPASCDTACDTAESWLTQRFGTHLYNIFFAPYCQKLWGQPAHQLVSDCAILMVESISGSHAWYKNVQPLIKQREGGIELKDPTDKLIHQSGRIEKIIPAKGECIALSVGDFVVSALPVKLLVQQLEPTPPMAVREAANCLRDRSTITVTLVLNQNQLSQDELLTECEIHIQSPGVQVSHIQHLNQPSTENFLTAEQICLGLTYLCDEGDALWQLSNKALVQLASQDLMDLKLIPEIPTLIESGQISRQAAAYPILSSHYYQHQSVVQNYLDQFENLSVAMPTDNRGLSVTIEAA